MSDIVMHVESLLGSDIKNVCSEMVGLASRLKVIITSDFNGVRIVAKPGDKPENVEKRWSEGISKIRQEHSIINRNGKQK